MNKMRPVHPGEILREEFMEPLGLSANALALALRVPAPRVGDIVRERRGISPDTALRIARYFGTTPQFWMNLQTSYDLKAAQRSAGSRIEDEVVPRGSARHVRPHSRGSSQGAGLASRKHRGGAPASTPR